MSKSEKAKALAAVALALLLAPRLAAAWGDNGHRVVGRIAEERLSDEARREVGEIAGSLSLAMLATWPDFIRAEPAWEFASRWHWVTVEDGQTVDEVLARSSATLEPDNLIEAIEYLTAILAGDLERRRNFEQLMQAEGAEPFRGSLELTALAYLVHSVGDLHQPLHVGRGGDRGGNQIRVNWFGDVVKLHWLWDHGFIEHMDLSYTELVDVLERELGGAVEPGEGSVRDWAQESYDYRGELYEIWSRTSRENYLPDLSWDYNYRHSGTVKRRLYLAGLRLAGLLDSIFE